MISISEEEEKKSNSLAFKAEDFNSDSDMPFIVKNFKIFLIHEKKRGTRKR